MTRLRRNTSAAQSVSDVERDAEATEVRLALRTTQRTLVMEIADNGKAFELQRAHFGKGASRLLWRD